MNVCTRVDSDWRVVNKKQKLTSANLRRKLFHRKVGCAKSGFGSSAIRHKENYVKRTIITPTAHIRPAICAQPCQKLYFKVAHEIGALQLNVFFWPMGEVKIWSRDSAATKNVFEGVVQEVNDRSCRSTVP